MTASSSGLDGLSPSGTQVVINGSDLQTLTLLHLDLPREAVSRFTTMAGTGEWPLKYALGAQALREGFVEVIDLRDLGPMTLSNYLGAAHDITPRTLGADVDQIDALSGHVVVLPAQAFDATSQTLTIAPPLTLVGRYGPPPPKARSAMLQSDSTLGQGTGGAPVPPRKTSLSIKLLLIGLGVLMLLVLALVL